MIKIGQNIIRSTVESTTETPQPPQEPQVTESPKYEPLVKQARSFELASSMMAERRMSNLAIEFSLRNKLDALLVSTPTKTPEVPTTLPGGNAEGPTGDVGIGTPGDDEIGNGQSGLKSDPASIIPTPLSVNSPSGTEVKLLQMELNKWRKENGQEPLEVTGNFGKDTTEALKEFQRANELDDDGVFGPITKHHMILENNDNFKGLPESDQRLVREHMLSYGTDPDRRERVVDFATRPDFLNCDSSIARRNTLTYLAVPLDQLPFKGVGDKDQKNLENYLENRTEMAKNANFQGLNQETKDKIDEESEQYLFYKPDKFELVKSLTSSEAFAKLEPDASQMFRTLNRIVGGDQNRFDDYQNILNNATDLDKNIQAQVLNAAERNGGLDSGIQSLNTMVSSDLFKNAPPELQQNMIDMYFVLFPGSDIEIV